jgi:Sec-independent protein secretion pathway component TatC
MLFLAIPVQMLYEVSVFIAWTWWRKEQKELAALESGDGAAT